MYQYKHVIKERFDLEITAQNQTFKGEFELDKNARFVVGIALTSNRDDLLFYRGSQKIQLNDQEVLPENFEAKLLMSGLNVRPNDRMVKFDHLPTGNGRFEVWYKDQTHPSTTFAPYRVSFYVFSSSQNQA